MFQAAITGILVAVGVVAAVLTVLVAGTIGSPAASRTVSRRAVPAPRPNLVVR